MIEILNYFIFIYRNTDKKYSKKDHDSFKKNDFNKKHNKDSS